MLYFFFIHTYINYENITWGNTKGTSLEKSNSQQKHFIRIIHCKDRYMQVWELFWESNIFNNILTWRLKAKHWRLPTNFNNQKNSVWNNVFWHIKMCIFWKCIQYSIHWDKTRISKKNSLRQNKRYKKALLFLLCVPTHYSFPFNLRFLYELKHKLRLFNVEFSIFDSFSFLLKFIFLLNKMHGLFDVKTPYFLSKLK